MVAIWSALYRETKSMDFNVSPEIENFRLRIREFVENHVIPLEKDSTNFDKYDHFGGLTD